MVVLSNKSQRIAGGAIETLSKKKNYLTLAEFWSKKPGALTLFRELRLSSGQVIYLTDKALSAIDNLHDCLAGVIHKSYKITDGDLHKAIIDLVKRIYCEEIKAEDFFNELDLVLVSSQKDYVTYACLQGLGLQGFDCFQIGPFAFQNASRDLLKHVQGNEENVDHVWKKTKGRLLVSCSYTGSEDYIDSQFSKDAARVCSALALAFTTALDKGIIGVRLVPEIRGHNYSSSNFRFWVSADGERLVTSVTMGAGPYLNLSKENFELLEGNNWYAQLMDAARSEPKTEIEEVIVRALHWFYGAQSEEVLEMQFVKLWSCIECVFSFEKAKVLSAIRNGLSAVLVFGGFRFVEFKEIKHLRSRITKLYDLRSEAVHDAAVGHVEVKDVVELSKWAAWLVLELVALRELGYKTRREIKEQSDRLTIIADQSIKRSSL